MARGPLGPPDVEPVGVGEDARLPVRRGDHGGHGLARANPRAAQIGVRTCVARDASSKRTLYFAVLADLAEHPPGSSDLAPARTAREALTAFARAWVTRLPIVADEPGSTARLGMDLMPEIAADERTRQSYARLMRLNAILLGLALEGLGPPARWCA